jgi:hypothetical protein
MAFFGFSFLQHDHTILVGGFYINFTISAPCGTSFISTFVLIFQRSASFTGPYIFLTSFLSNIFLTSLKSFTHH